MEVSHGLVTSSSGKTTSSYIKWGNIVIVIASASSDDYSPHYYGFPKAAYPVFASTVTGQRIVGGNTYVDILNAYIDTNGHLSLPSGVGNITFVYISSE